MAMFFKRLDVLIFQYYDYRNFVCLNFLDSYNVVELLLFLKGVR